LLSIKNNKKDRNKQILTYHKKKTHELETMLVGITNQWNLYLWNLLSSLGSILNALSLPRTAFFRWVSEVISLCAGLAGAVVADVAVALLRGLVAVQSGMCKDAVAHRGAEGGLRKFVFVSSFENNNK
jgi:hypothetical protein